MGGPFLSPVRQLSAAGLPQAVVEYKYDEGSGSPLSESDSLLPGRAASMRGMGWGTSSIYPANVPATQGASEIPDHDALTFLDAVFTVSVRFQIWADTAATDHYIAAKSNFNANQREWFIRHTNRTVEWGISSLLAGDWTLMFSDTLFPVTTNEWLFCVAEGGGNFAMYFNDTEVARVSGGATSMQNGSADVTVAGADNGTFLLESLNGSVLYFRVDSEALTAQQRTLVMARD